MGIPNLIATLEPYAVHSLLRDERVVVDGPALAYHVLHICRANGIQQPSNRLLGSTVIAWLTVLVEHHVSIEAIYFDGYLPSSKLAERMKRTYKTSNQFIRFVSKQPNGCPRLHVCNRDKDILIEPFKTGCVEGVAILPPSLLVPAVIHALQRSRFKKVVKLVPGEADAYCARHAAKDSCIVLTSDSDLLVHNLESGRVAFLRDTHLDTDGVPACAVFVPQDICKRLGLLPRGLLRLAYEKQLSTHLNLSQILRICAQPVGDEHDYEAFSQQYLDNETCSLPKLQDGASILLDNLDPRVSELILQLGCAEPRKPINTFLPMLYEDPSRGSAWEPSFHIRQLACSLARWAIAGHETTVFEFRRIQAIDQRGRQVNMLNSTSMVSLLNDLATVMRDTKAQTLVDDESFWIYLCLALDIRDRQVNGKPSHVLETIKHQGSRQQYLDSAHIPWSFVHFVAHIHAGLYSLRILSQVLSLIPAGAVGELSASAPFLRDVLSGLPAPELHPCAQDVAEFLSQSGPRTVARVLARFVDVGSDDSREAGSSLSTGKKRQAKKRKRASQGSSKSMGNGTAGNTFGVLAVDW
ncbi:XPG domain containing-domain-containing protein [Stachybotrys elegans]|uniref:XPG domain containing-domain-containing protein n=1 Tax=Stachybotrys elegans TaxID=80388 RepID=A0A8K0SXB7_9HYPO|nr:XPG domain containing-domain-containing protein [Stachybotrys elegans]